MIHNKLAPVNYNNYNNLMLSYDERLAAIKEQQKIAQIIKQQKEKFRMKKKQQKKKSIQFKKHRNSSDQDDRQKERSRHKKHKRHHNHKQSQRRDRHNKKAQNHSHQSKSYKYSSESFSSSSSSQSFFSSSSSSSISHYKSRRFKQQAVKNKSKEVAYNLNQISRKKSYKQSEQPKYTPFSTKDNKDNKDDQFSFQNKYHNSYDRIFFVKQQSQDQTSYLRKVGIQSRFPFKNSQPKAILDQKTIIPGQKMVVMVFNLDYKINQKAFIKIGQLYGEVERCKIYYDKYNLRSKQIGILWYHRFKDGELAAQKLNSQIINSKELVAKFTKYKNRGMHIREYLWDNQHKLKHSSEQ